MADQSDYTAVANALVRELTKDIDQVSGWARSFIPADLPQQLAGPLAKIAVDAVDAHRAASQQTKR